MSDFSQPPMWLSINPSSLMLSLKVLTADKTQNWVSVNKNLYPRTLIEKLLPTVSISESLKTSLVQATGS